jgi:hypothetical protein
LRVADDLVATAIEAAGGEAPVVSVHFDRCQELVQVDVLYPDRCQRPHSLRARLSQASPSSFRVRPRSLIWCST